MESNSSVYSYYSASGMLVYVGVTDRGVRRQHEHADSKPWWPLVAGCAIEHYEGRGDALARERFLIETYRPAFNYQHNPDRDLPHEVKVAKCTFRPFSGSPAPLPSPDSVQAAVPDAPGAVVDVQVPPKPMPSPAVYGLMTLKERRQFYMTLTREQRRVFPCVMCGERAGHQGRPMCLPCLTAKKEWGRAEGLRRIALGEARKAQIQSAPVRQMMPTDTLTE